MSPRLLLSCGEASGDLYAGALTRELLALDPTLHISGLGGPQFAAAGPVPWQLVATVPLTILWAVIGIFVARTMSKDRAERATHLGVDHDLPAVA